MVKEQEEICRKAIIDIISNEYPVADFSFAGYKEDAVCFQQIDNGWGVYIGYRAKKDRLNVYPNIVDACLQMIRIMTAGNKEKEECLDDLFFSRIIKTA